MSTLSRWPDSARWYNHYIEQARCKEIKLDSNSDCGKHIQRLDVFWFCGLRVVVWCFCSTAWFKIVFHGRFLDSPNISTATMHPCVCYSTLWGDSLHVVHHSIPTRGSSHRCFKHDKLTSLGNWHFVLFGWGKSNHLTMYLHVQSFKFRLELHKKSWLLMSSKPLALPVVPIVFHPLRPTVVWAVGSVLANCLGTGGVAAGGGTLLFKSNTPNNKTKLICWWAPSIELRVDRTLLLCGIVWGWWGRQPCNSVRSHVRNKCHGFSQFSEWA